MIRKCSHLKWGLFLGLLLFAVPPTVQAQDFAWTTNDGTITIIGATQAGYDASTLSIPDIITGLPVTSIGDAAFAGFVNLTSVTIPSSVTSLGDNVFNSCVSLTSVCFEGKAPMISGDDTSVFRGDPLTVIYYVSGATGWGSTFEGIPTAPCTQCAGQLPDLIASYLDWNTNEGVGGLTFGYALQGAALPKATDAALFWADGTNESNIITNTPIYDEPIPADFAVGTSNEVQVPASDLANPPSGATYILLVLDPNSLITESTRANNTLALPEPVMGIDVSSANGTIIWGKVAKAGVRFTYVRASLGLPPDVDDELTNNADGATTNNIEVGVYHVSYAYRTTNNTGTAEADALVNAAGSWIGANFLPPAVDIEDDPGLGYYVKNLKPGLLQQYVTDFATEVKCRTGADIIIYTGGPWLQFFGAWAQKYGLWFSNPNGDPNANPTITPWKSMAIFQYDLAPVNGVPGDTNGDTDLDVIRGGLATPGPPQLTSLTVGTMQNTTLSLPTSTLAAGLGVGPCATITGVSGGTVQGGTVTLATTQITYNPPNGFVGQDQFSVDLSAGPYVLAGTVLVTVGASSASASAVVPAGQAATALMSPGPSQAGAMATVDNGSGSQSTTFSTASYPANPAPVGVGGPGSTFLDLQVSGASAESSMTAYFYSPPGVTATALAYYDEISSGWMPVFSSGGQLPLLDPTPDLDGTSSGGRFTVVFDETSTPEISNLTGTIFALATSDLNLSILSNSVSVSAGQFQFTVTGVVPGVTVYTQAWQTCLPGLFTPTLEFL
jgi:GH25 family lysozyme M1 (1,4-beta-N-acetylmuramidase)